MSRYCPVLKLASEMGLPTLHVSSGSDVEDLTYRHAMMKIEEVAKTRLVGFCNRFVINCCTPP